MRELRILIADDHQLIRRGIHQLLASRSEWRIVGEACNGAEGVRMAETLRPDIAILDFSMPLMNGPAATAEIRKNVPGVAVIILTMHESERVDREVRQAGARGLVLKSDADRSLLGAVEAVSEGRRFFPMPISPAPGADRPAYAAPLQGNGARIRLTPREAEIMRLLSDGLTSRAAATRLQISIRTVESHRININRKLGFTSIADLVRYAMRHGIEDPVA
jgi:DNA-binding NarL/FixJ family response regulator